ncbi:MAG: hypothetical protein VR65_22190 [Desulfobulbaceae bacterium BRH_c16a]|nr:MAG: hypothetical protein VR65_22190 [Desulfobulbaceae bacterium BRH_c16a]
MKEQTTKTVNGIDVGKLAETIQAIKETPSIADFKFRISNKWQGGGLNQTTVNASYGAGQEFPDREGKFTMQADEPPILLSGDQAANPVEHLLHALAACVTTSMVYHAAARKIPLEAVESHLEGELDLHGFLGLDPDVRKGFKNITFNVRLTGDLSEEQKQEVMSCSQFSPVFDMVTNTVPVTVKLVN